MDQSSSTTDNTALRLGEGSFSVAFTTAAYTGATVNFQAVGEMLEGLGFGCVPSVEAYVNGERDELIQRVGDNNLIFLARPGISSDSAILCKELAFGKLNSIASAYRQGLYVLLADNRSVEVTLASPRYDPGRQARRILATLSVILWVESDMVMVTTVLHFRETIDIEDAVGLSHIGSIIVSLTDASSCLQESAKSLGLVLHDDGHPPVKNRYLLAVVRDLTALFIGKVRGLEDQDVFDPAGRSEQVALTRSSRFTSISLQAASLNSGLPDVAKLTLGYSKLAVKDPESIIAETNISFSSERYMTLHDNRLLVAEEESPSDSTKTARERLIYWIAQGTIAGELVAYSNFRQLTHLLNLDRLIDGSRSSAEIDREVGEMQTILYRVQNPSFILTDTLRRLVTEVQRQNQTEPIVASALHNVNIKLTLLANRRLEDVSRQSVMLQQWVLLFSSVLAVSTILLVAASVWSLLIHLDLGFYAELGMIAATVVITALGMFYLVRLMRRGVARAIPPDEGHVSSAASSSSRGSQPPQAWWGR